MLSPAERAVLDEIEVHVLASDPELARLLTEQGTADATNVSGRQPWPLLLWVLLAETGVMLVLVIALVSGHVELPPAEASPD